MKHVCCLGALAVAALAAQAAPPEHAVLWVVDGISYKAPDRIDLPNLKSLMAAGVYYRQTYTVETADPSHQPGQWSQYHTSSIPNPVLLAGTVMLLPGAQHYVQESFFPQRITAHSTNEIAYRALNVGFSLTFQGGGQAVRVGGKPQEDSMAVHWAAEFMRQMQPAFLLVHLQDTGEAGSRSRSAPANVAWKDNIWGEGSPYRQTLSQADVYLGQFIEELKKERLWDSTVIFVTGDHGQTDTGWHAADAEDAWAMPLVMAGPGIKHGQRLEYAEAIDIVPTLCFLMGVKPPPNATGRILAEGLENPPANVPPRLQKLKELDYLLRDTGAAMDKAKAAGKDITALDAQYYRIERILEWNRFGTIDQLIEHHKRLLEQARALTPAAR
jgi:hypothetical protein